MLRTRRQFLQTAASLTAAAATRPARAFPSPSDRLGIGSSSYSIHWRQKRGAGFTEPLAFLEFCHARGAGGIQAPLGMRDEAQTSRLRARAEELGMFLEGSVTTPQDESGAEQFAQELITAKRAGATVVRTVLLGGRRYETFKTLAEFRAFKEQAWRRLTIVEPIVARHNLWLAVENHKDFRAEEQSEMLERLSSDHVGACVDTGNNLALLETPEETVRVLAPWAMSCHLKDMAVERADDGFLLAEVPLGQGVLDLPAIVRALRAARPELRFSLEMITRDPLRIPHLTAGYWETLFETPISRTRPAVEYVRSRFSTPPLPRIGGLTADEQLATEESNVIASLQYARESLGL
jgi:sugar phosphate isomerase/epimerase